MEASGAKGARREPMTLVAQGILLVLLMVIFTSADSVCASTAMNVAFFRILDNGSALTDSDLASLTPWLSLALKCRPSSPSLARWKAFVYSHRGQTVDAAQLIERAGPQDEVSFFWLGEAYSRQGRQDEAIAAWRKAKAAPYFIVRGQKAYEEHDLEAICRNYLLGVAIAPDMALAQMYAGHCYNLRGEYVLAEQAYRRAIELAPTYGYPYIHIANMFFFNMKLPEPARSVLEDCMAHMSPGYWRQACQEAATSFFGSAPR